MMLRRKFLELVGASALAVATVKCAVSEVSASKPVTGLADKPALEPQQPDAENTVALFHPDGTEVSGRGYARVPFAGFDKVTTFPISGEDWDEISHFKIFSRSLAIPVLVGDIEQPRYVYANRVVDLKIEQGDVVEFEYRR